MGLRLKSNLNSYFAGEKKRKKKKMGKGTMRAVVFKGPYNVVLEDRPIPEIREPTDMIVRVKYAALCGR